MMSTLDLSKFSDSDLIELNQMIINQLESRQRLKRKKALSAFEVADEVYFDDPEGARHHGTVLRVNQKSLTIRTQGGTWRVSPMFVKKAIRGSKDGRLINLKRPRH